MMPTIEIAHLTKRYGATTAVDDLTLRISKGSVCGLLGPNGAGKTTTFKCMLGLAQSSWGTVRFDGAPLAPQTFERLAYVPEKSMLYEWMTGAEHLEVVRRSYTRYDPTRAAELTALFGLDQRKTVRTLSRGQRTALMLVLAFCTRPEILVLDEPASGLDPEHQRSVLDLVIDAAAGGATVIFSSHQITQVERAADLLAIIKGGRLILDGDLDTLKSSERIVEAIFEQPPSLNGVANDPRVRRIEQSGRVVRVHVRHDSEGFARALAALGPKHVEILDQSLEELYLNAVAGTVREPSRAIEPATNSRREWET
jgi:ABC-type multidrug transport system ATPase subunit